MFRNHSKTPIVFVFLLALGIAALGATPSTAQTWNVDPSHSQVNFSIKHFFTPVTGNFGEFDIQLTYDAENPGASSVSVTIPVASVDTGSERRDGHLKTADFFESETYPNITFRSTAVRAEGDRLIATGPLTIKGVAKEIELPIQLLGTRDVPEPMQQMFGGATQVAGFTATTTIDRGDFGVGTGNYAATLIIGGDVEIEIQVEAHLR